MEAIVVSVVAVSILIWAIFGGFKRLYEYKQSQTPITKDCDEP
jgi:hypothetical protein